MQKYTEIQSYSSHSSYNSVTVFGHTLWSIDIVMQNTKATSGYGWLGEP